MGPDLLIKVHRQLVDPIIQEARLPYDDGGIADRIAPTRRVDYDSRQEDPLPNRFLQLLESGLFPRAGLAQTYGASLTIVYVHAPGSGDKARWRDQLEQVRPADPKIPVSHVLLEGDPASEIARYAADASIDVIVIGTHGRTGVDRLVMGSVAERVMRKAPARSWSSSCPRVSLRPASPMPRKLERT